MLGEHRQVWGDDFPLAYTGPIPSNRRIDKLISIHSIPSDRWVGIHIEVIPGNSSHGKFKMTMSYDGIVHPIFDDHIRTICKAKTFDGEDKEYDDSFNSSSYTAPHSYSMKTTRRAIYENFSPMTLYTSTQVQKECHPEIFFRNYHLDCIRSIKEGDMLLL